MAEFTVNASRIDPYKNFKFLVYFQGQTTPVAGISKVGGLTRTSEPIEHRDGGDPSTVQKSPGMIKFESITLERGVTHDATFETWANQVWKFNNQPTGRANSRESSLANFRKNISIELLNEAGQPAIRYNVYRCWVSSFKALPELDASGAAVAIQSITIEHEGWERDISVNEPKEPVFD